MPKKNPFGRPCRVLSSLMDTSIHAFGKVRDVCCPNAHYQKASGSPCKLAEDDVLHLSMTVVNLKGLLGGKN